MLQESIFTTRHGTPGMHRRPAASPTTGPENIPPDSTYSP